MTNRASILVTDETGVPLAHTLLSTTGHPLRSALISNSELTLNSISFYKRLIADLSRYRKNNRLDESQDQLVKESLISYEEAIKQIELMPDSSKPIGKMLNRKLVAFKEKIATSYSDQIITQLQNDIEIRSLNSAYVANLHVFINKLPADQRKQVALMGYKVLDKASEAMLASCNIESDTFEDLKSDMITFLKDSIELVDNASCWTSTIFTGWRQLSLPVLC